jgi:hypothetical protein
MALEGADCSFFAPAASGGSGNTTIYYTTCVRTLTARRECRLTFK